MSSPPDPTVSITVGSTPTSQIQFNLDKIDFTITSTGDSLIINGAGLFDQHNLELNTAQIKATTEGRFQTAGHLITAFGFGVNGEYGCTLSTMPPKGKILDLILTEVDNYGMVRNIDFPLKRRAQTAGADLQSIKATVTGLMLALKQQNLNGYDGPFRFDPLKKEPSLLTFNNDTALNHFTATKNATCLLLDSYDSGIHHAEFKLTHRTSNIYFGVMPDDETVDLTILPGLPPSNVGGAHMNISDCSIYYEKTYDRTTRRAVITGSYVGIRLDVDKKEVTFYVNGVDFPTHKIEGDRFRFAVSIYAQYDVVEIIPELCWSERSINRLDAGTTAGIRKVDTGSAGPSARCY
eukprot:CAMPEP_0168523910 /NCGR_PEP_ID=MMETSP0405-20121227/10296_1 /TAXON_ID=498012 /ORGANISM="Trichosphaerium sp, Strain Am-I-7 wt" /LENGTH=349 /DNA_ID=CAMNT_0008545937 /DNA_START=106 /DNA_END=1155 /DNA_ORIENTATION=+